MLLKINIDGMTMMIINEKFVAVGGHILGFIATLLFFPFLLVRKIIRARLLEP